MEVEETSLKDNPLLKRKELVLKVVAEAATPKKNELLDKVCSKYNVSDKKLVIIDSIRPSFGKLDCEAIVKIYDSENALKAVEPQLKEKKEKTPSDIPDESGQIKVETGAPSSGAPKEESKEEKKVEGEKVEGSETPESGAPSSGAPKSESAKQELKSEEKK